MSWNLFALTRDPGRRILRLSLCATVQGEVTELFRSQERNFRAAATETVPFDGKYKPDEGEVLVIAEYDDIDGVANAIRNPMACAELEAAPGSMLAIKAVFSGCVNQDGSVTALIQSFDRRKVISRSGISLFHSSGVFKKIDGVGMTLEPQISAIMEGGSLRFFSFHSVRQIFDMSAYYKEATDGDINDFASMAVINAPDVAALLANADSWVRRKVALIQQSQILETVPLNDIRAVALEFGIEVDVEVIGGVEKIQLPSQKAKLKALLRLLDEDYYESPLSKTRYITNSKRRADRAVSEAE